MRRITLALLLYVGLAVTGHAQIAVSGSITAASAACATAGSCVTAALLSDDGAASVTITGTFTATAQFEASNDNLTWVNVTGDPLPSGAGVTSATAAGTWVLNIAGMSHFRIRASAYTSGVIEVRIRSSPAVAKRVSSLTAGNITVGGMTAGSVLFAGTGGLLSQDNANLFWDDAANSLGIGTGASVSAVLDIGGTGSIFIGEDSATTNQVLKNFTVAHAAGNVPSQLTIGLKDSATTGMLIKNVADGGFNSASIEFTTHHGGVSAGTRLTLDKDGLATFVGALRGADGSVAAPQYAFTNASNSGLFRYGDGALGLSMTGVPVTYWSFAEFRLPGNGILGFTPTNDPSSSSIDTNLYRGAANVLKTDDTFSAPLYATNTNCADNAGAAACAAAPAGAVVIDAAATTVVVSTTAVTANSRIFIQEGPYLATELAITCNTTTGRIYTVTALTAATSFTITSSAAPAATAACLNYWVVN